MLNKDEVKQQWEKHASRPLTKIGYFTHITHLENALRILKDDQIKPILTQDTDRLNFLKLSVTWLSPNHYPEGSIYGNVAFAYELTTLIRNRKIYWFDEPTGHKGVRFLVTELDYSTWLVEYNPLTDEGPLRYNRPANAYEWTTDTSLQLLFEGALSLADCKEISFVDHNPTNCVRRPHCNQYYNRLEAGDLFVTGMVTNQIKGSKTLFFDNNRKLKFTFQKIVNRLITKHRKVNYKKRIGLDSPEAVAYGQACLYFLSVGNKDACKLMAENFHEWSDYADTIQRILANYFEVQVSDIDDE